MCAVNVGDEVQREIGVAVGLQGLGDHDGTTSSGISTSQQLKIYSA